MSVASAAISWGAGNLSPLPLPRCPGWRFNFVEVLADYRYLSAAVMENEAQASSEQGAGTLIRTAALGRFPRRERWDGAGKDTLDVRWTHQGPTHTHTHCSWYSSPPYYLIGSLHAGRLSTFVGGIKGLRGSPSDWIHWPTHKKISRHIDKRKISLVSPSGFISEKVLLQKIVPTS